MNETKTTERRPRRWLRWVAILFGGLFLLLIVAYFVGTSGWFLKSVILPKASAAINGKVTVEDASISPFSAVTLRGLRVETKGPDPLVTAKEVRLRYKLMDIIGGNINVDEVVLESPVVTLVTFPDGSTNLDPITKKEESEPKKEEPKKDDGKPARVDLKKFALNNAIVRKIDQRKDGTKQTLELSGVNITADQIGNNKTGKIGIAANVHLDQGLNTSSNGVLSAKVGGNFDIALDQALKPKSAKGQTRLDVTEGKGAFQQANGFGIVLNTDLTPTQLNDVSLRFAQGGSNLGALAVSGPFNAETMEGKLAIALSGIDRKLLNIAGAATGIDFNQTTISSTNTVELTQRGRIVTLNGQLLVGTLSLTQKGQTTPVLDIRSGYAMTYDQTNKTALVQSFALNGSQQGNEFLRGTLSKPMLLNLGSASNAVDESAFDLVITNFNLPDWKAFAGTNVTLASGRLGMNLNLVSQQAGKTLSLNLATRLSDLTAASGSNRIENADLSLDARGTVRDFKAVNLEQYRATLARGGQQALLASGALAYNTQSGDADVQANLETSLPQVTALVSVAGLNLTDGTVKFAGRVTQKNTTPQQTNNPVLDRTVVGKLNVDGLTGAFQSNRFDRFATAIDIDVAMRGPSVDIRKCNGTLQQSGQAGGAFEVAGKYHLENKAGQITAKLTDLNHHALKSFVAGALGEKQLESVTINATTTAKLDGPEAFDAKAELHVANLVVNDPSGAVPKTPLAIDFIADAAQVKKVIDLRQVQLALTKTDRAPNSLNVAGRVDMTKSNAYTGNLKITSDGLDVTPYYELFAKKQTNAATASKGGTTGPAPSPDKPAEQKPQVEPPAMNLPVSKFDVDVNIAKFFLREVAISNLITKTTVENGRIAVSPLSMSLNGAPVTLTALANVSVPGYEYDIKAGFDHVPMEPVVNTFQPERRGQVKGNLILNSQIKGAGITDRSVQKNLQGLVTFVLTNAEVQVTEYKRAQLLLRPLAAALNTPELAQSPITWADVRLGIGNGTVTLTNTTVETALLRAGVPGTITLKEVLTNSTLNNLPVQLEFRRTLVGKIKYLPVTQTSGDYVGLPHFYSIGGTIGQPKPHVDTAALAKIAAGEALKYVPGEAGQILRGIGGRFGLGPMATNAPAAGTNTTSQTNAPASTNTMGNVLRGLGGLLQKPADTNVSTNTSGTNEPPRRRRGFNLNELIK